MLWNEVGYCCVLSDIRDSKARNNLSLSKMQWWITVFQITNKSINSSCEVVMVASQNILCFLPTEKRPWEDQTELENWSPVSSAWRSNTKWYGSKIIMIQNIVSIDFVFQPAFCWVDGWLLVFKEPGQEVAVVAAVWSLESAAELPILILCVTKR